MIISLIFGQLAVVIVHAFRGIMAKFKKKKGPNSGGQGKSETKEPLPGSNSSIKKLNKKKNKMKLELRQFYAKFEPAKVMFGSDLAIAARAFGSK